jgi:hypothetical protein
MVECQCEALGSIPSTANKKKKKEKNEEAVYKIVLIFLIHFIIIRLNILELLIALFLCCITIY